MAANMDGAKALKILSESITSNCVNRCPRVRLQEVEDVAKSEEYD
jgi:hypothetical protein